MPHLVIETTTGLGDLLDFPTLLKTLHTALAGGGDARLGDLKSRVHRVDSALAGNDPDAQFIVVRLITTNPRSAEAEQRMIAVIHQKVSDALVSLDLNVWWQCCVMIERVARGDYLKSESQPSKAQELP